ncbi:MAG: ERF family protein [Treponema sp.]|nr:ERF family protein [Treponema sp.]MBR6153886.1 ERF family protein [Treponema sp.]
MENAMIYKQICAVMNEINAIGKDRKNQQQNFKYRGIDDVMNEMHGVLAKCKVFVVPEVLDEARTIGKTKSGSDMFYTRLKIRFTFYTEDGSSVQSVVIGEAMDTADKASNKALSVGLKYALLQVFCIPTEDEKDPDATSPEPKTGTMGGNQQQGNSQVTAPAGQAVTPASYAPKGGESSPEEKARITELCGAKYANGKRVFSNEEIRMYCGFRETKTAAEVIAFVENALRNRRKDAPELPENRKSTEELAQQALQPDADIY